ncbi:MAG: ribose 5-phosphate isomerase B [Ruminococcaceae bacterium]|nr:ribose 5-phosphate isomerase B [Oscillospiraceae bacterium]
MIAIGSDHGGFKLKAEVMAHLDSLGVEYRDFGAKSSLSSDYADYAEAVGKAVASGECEAGILICGTGIGISIAANKVRGVRCALCNDCFSAEMSRRHNNANILALGERVLGVGLALRIVDIFISTGFDGGRHERRVNKVMALEQ